MFPCVALKGYARHGALQQFVSFRLFSGRLSESESEGESPDLRCRLLPQMRNGISLRSMEGVALGREDTPVLRVG